MLTSITQYKTVDITQDIEISGVPFNYGGDELKGEHMAFLLEAIYGRKHALGEDITIPFDASINSGWTTMCNDGLSSSNVFYTPDYTRFEFCEISSGFLKDAMDEYNLRYKDEDFTPFDISSNSPLLATDLPKFARDNMSKLDKCIHERSNFEGCFNGQRQRVSQITSRQIPIGTRPQGYVDLSCGEYTSRLHTQSIQRYNDISSRYDGEKWVYFWLGGNYGNNSELNDTSFTLDIRMYNDNFSDNYIAQSRMMLLWTVNYTCYKPTSEGGTIHKTYYYTSTTPATLSRRYDRDNGEWIYTYIVSGTDVKSLNSRVYTSVIGKSEVKLDPTQWGQPDDNGPAFGKIDVYCQPLGMCYKFWSQYTDIQ